MSPPLRTPAAMSGGIEGRSEGGRWPDRLIRIALAVYLLPVLLVVLMVGGIGLLVLVAARLLSRAAEMPADRPGSPVGPGPLP